MYTGKIRRANVNRTYLPSFNFFSYFFFTVFSELMSHENVTFNENGTLSTIPHHPLEWREDLSGGRTEDDVFYLPNIALLVSFDSIFFFS